VQDRQDHSGGSTVPEANNRKLKITISPKGEVEIIGNRLGLKSLSDICAGLSESVGKPGNHYHFCLTVDPFCAGFATSGLRSYSGGRPSGIRNSHSVTPFPRIAGRPLGCAGTVPDCTGWAFCNWLTRLWTYSGCLYARNPALTLPAAANREISFKFTSTGASVSAPRVPKSLG
jgi:hypothetical protein